MLGFDGGWSSGVVRSLIRHGLFIVLPVAAGFVFESIFSSFSIRLGFALATFYPLASTIGALAAVPAAVRFCPPELRWQAFVYGLYETLAPMLVLCISVVLGLLIVNGELGPLGRSVVEIGLICLGLEAVILAVLTLFGLRRGA